MNNRSFKDVLIVDDDDHVRGLLCTSVAQRDMTCDHANDGVAALDFLRSCDYSVILLDLMMPLLDGAGVLAELQKWARPADSRPVILVITAFADNEAAPLPGDLVQAIIRKPLEVGDLTGLVAGCVAARRSHAATLGATC